MRSITRERMAPVGILLLVGIGVVTPKVSGQASAPASNVVELTQTDLFSLSGWQQKTVAVDGFAIGMTAVQANDLAKASKLRLIPQKLETIQGAHSPCREGHCEVYKDNGNWVGIDIFFALDRISKIKVSVPIHADPDVKKVNVAHSFRGLTRQFFNSYSDALREKILGRTEGKRTHDILSGRPDTFFTHIEFDYPPRGVDRSRNRERERARTVRSRG